MITKSCKSAICALRFAISSSFVSKVNLVALLGLYVLNWPSTAPYGLFGADILTEVRADRNRSLPVQMMGWPRDWETRIVLIGSHVVKFNQYGWQEMYFMLTVQGVATTSFSLVLFEKLLHNTTAPKNVPQYSPKLLLLGRW